MPLWGPRVYRRQGSAAHPIAVRVLARGRLGNRKCGQKRVSHGEREIQSDGWRSPMRGVLQSLVGGLNTIWTSADPGNLAERPLSIPRFNQVRARGAFSWECPEPLGERTVALQPHAH